MRVLISTTGNEGHFGPLMPLARAAVLAGHEVQVAAPASFAATVRQAGFSHLPFADPPPELVGPVMARLPALSFDEANETVMREVFGRLDAQAALPGLQAALAYWRPDMIIRDPAELGSLAAAERAGVPHLQVAIGMTEIVRTLAVVVAEPLAELGRLVGLAADVLSVALAREPLFSTVPEPLDRAGDDQYDEGAVSLRFGHDSVPPTSEPFPDWGDPAWPMVYVTFGSVTGSLPPFAGVFREALDGLADLPVRVLMTVGRRVPLSNLGMVPANAKVEAWRPQGDVLRNAALVLGHGGFGTTMGAICAGLPQVVVPLFASDQIINGRHVAAVGAARSVGPAQGAVSRACEEVSTVLGDPAYRTTAAHVATANASLPTAADAVAFIQSLVG